jgi:peroxiredoxin
MRLARGCAAQLLSAKRPEDPARRLAGVRMPLAGLQQVSGGDWSPGDGDAEWVAYYLYPGASTSPEDAREGPAADRAQHHAFSAERERLAVYGVRIAGVSSQTPQEQFDTITANRIDHVMLSDPDLALAHTLDLPTFEHDARSWYRRLTLLTHAGEIRWVFYPIENATANPRQVITWLQINGATR